MHTKPPTACRIELRIAHQQIVISCLSRILQEVRKVTVTDEALRAVAHQIVRNHDSLLAAATGNIVKRRPPR